MISLAVPNLNGNEKKYLDHCIDTTFVSSVGEYVNRFEEMVAEATGSAHAVATSAGTTGLHAALTAVGVGRDDLVVLPSFTFIASANAVSHCGAEPWLMDISEQDWCLDPEIVAAELEKNCEKREDKVVHKATGKRVAAIMPVYTLGNVPDMKVFHNISEEYGIPLVADAACAIGATRDAERIGTLADLSVLSFNGNKTVTCGGGGAVVGDDDQLLKLVKHLTTTARVSLDYDFDMVGFNYRMTNIQAAVGCAQMERMDELVERKRQIRAYYRTHLERLREGGTSFFPTTDGSSCWFSGIVLRPDSTEDEKRSIYQKLNQRGIESRPFWKPIHLQKPYAKVPLGTVHVAESVWSRIVTLPCSTCLTEEELDEVCKGVLAIV